MKLTPDEQRRRWEQEWELFETLCRKPGEDEPEAPAGGDWNVVSALGGDPRLRSLLDPLELPRAVSGEVDDPGFHAASMSTVGKLLGRGAQLAPGTIVQVASGGWESRPIFLLAIESHDDGTVTVAAFSPFSVPASGEEFETGIEADGLRVLALWNRRRIPVERLRQVWTVRDDTAELAAEARALREANRAGTPPPESIKDRVGPALMAPDDPRWAYFDVLGDWMEKAVGAA